MRGWLRGCAVALLLALGLCGVFAWRIGEPHRRAMEAHPKMRAGMSVREVYAVSGRWWSASGGDCGGDGERLVFYSASNFGGTGSGALVLSRSKPGAAKDVYETEQLRYDSRPQMLELIDRTLALQTCKQIRFTYLVTGVPPRTSFNAYFEAGKLTRVSAPHNWD